MKNQLPQPLSNTMFPTFKWWWGQLLGRRGIDRPFIANTTNGSLKWARRHVVGCVLHAPANKCICHEFGRTLRS